MTEDTGDNETNKAEGVESPQAAPKAERRVARTMLDVDASRLKMIRNLLRTQRKDDGGAEGVARTMEPSPLSAESARSQRRVARTLLDADVQIGEGLQVELTRDEPQSENAEKEAQPERVGEQSPAQRKVAKTLNEAEDKAEKPQSKRKVAKTALESDGPVVEPKWKRKVAKTSLESDVPVVESPQAQRKVAKTSLESDVPVQPEAKRKVAKTMLEADLSSVEQLTVVPDDIGIEQEAPAEPVQGAEPEPVSAPQAGSVAAPPFDPVVAPPPAKAEKVHYFVAKTLLDTNVLAAALEKYQVRKNEIAEEEARIRASQPGVEFHPVDSKKLVKKCPWRWDDEGSTDRVLFCPNCRTQVYDFDGLELPEAEELIFVRENKRNATLYKRTDGKFMTQPCPVQLKKQRTVIFLSIVGATLLFVLVASLIMMPPRLPPAHTIGGKDFQATELSTTKHSSSKTGKSAGADGRPGVAHTGTRKRPTFTPKDTNLYWE